VHSTKVPLAVREAASREGKARRIKFVEFVVIVHLATTLTPSLVNHAKLSFAAMLSREWITSSVHTMNDVVWIRRTGGFAKDVA